MAESTTCSKENCTNKVYCKRTGLCRKHSTDRKICVTEGCTKQAHCAGQLCDEHAGKKKSICSTEGCNNVAISGKQFCTRHGGRSLCKTEGCTKQAREGGHCRRHGAPIPMCSVEGCDKVVKNNHLCIEHGAEKTKLCSKCNKNQSRKGGICLKCGAVDLPHKGKCKVCKKVYGTKRYVKEEDDYVFHCADCFYETYPNEVRSKHSREKQKYLNKKLVEDFGETFFRHDKRVPNGQSEKRPDFLHIFDEYALIVECDEKHQYHKNKEEERERLEIIQKDLNNLPIICIRFNPDSYKKDNQTIRGCFKMLKEVTVFHKEFNLRYSKLKESIDNHKKPDSNLEVVELFYS